MMFYLILSLSVYLFIYNHSLKDYACTIKCVCAYSTQPQPDRGGGCGLGAGFLCMA